MQKIIIVTLCSLFLFGCTSKTPTSDSLLPTGSATTNLADNISIQNRVTESAVSPTPTSNLKINFKEGTMQNSNQADPKTISSDMLTIKTKYGAIVVKIYTDKAPNFINQFVTKAKNKFFDGLTFHRVEAGFVAQGGDPLGNGTGGGQIASEMNDVPFVRGSLGVARGPDIKINNDSQFFICLATESCSQLTSQYTNFGEVVSGMEFVDQITVGDKIISISQ